MIKYVSVDLIVTAPILGADGFARFHIDESGPITFIDPLFLVDDVSTLVIIESTTQSVVTPGEVFLGLKKPSKKEIEDAERALKLIDDAMNIIERIDKWREERRIRKNEGSSSASFESSSSLTTIVRTALPIGGYLEGGGSALERPTVFISEPPTITLFAMFVFVGYILKLIGNKNNNTIKISNF